LTSVFVGHGVAVVLQVGVGGAVVTGAQDAHVVVGMQAVRSPAPAHSVNVVINAQELPCGLDSVALVSCGRGAQDSHVDVGMQADRSPAPTHVVNVVINAQASPGGLGGVALVRCGSGGRSPGLLIGGRPPRLLIGDALPVLLIRGGPSGLLVGDEPPGLLIRGSDSVVVSHSMVVIQAYWSPLLPQFVAGVIVGQSL